MFVLHAQRPEKDHYVVRLSVEYCCLWLEVLHVLEKNVCIESVLHLNCDITATTNMIQLTLQEAKDKLCQQAW